MMKIIFKEKYISIISDRELIKESDKIVVTAKKGKSFLEIKNNQLTLEIKDSIEINEEYDEVSKVDYTLILDDDVNVRNVSLIKQNNQFINKNVIINENDNYEQVMIDLFKNDYKFKSIIDMNGTNSNCYSRVASMAASDKHIVVGVNHNTIGSSSKLDNYGVVTLNGNLLFEITGSIKKGCKKSSVLQNNKIILFDKESTGEIKPLLYIDENDVSASHAAAVGKVDDNHIFYLMSRGINVTDAKKSIAMGYLKPVLEYISDEKIKKEISLLMEKEVF